MVAGRLSVHLFLGDPSLAFMTCPVSRKLSFWPLGCCTIIDSAVSGCMRAQHNVPPLAHGCKASTGLGERVGARGPGGLQG